MKIWSAAEAGSVKLKIPAGRACATCVGPFGAASGGTCKGLIGVWSVPMLEGAAPGAARPVSVSIATVVPVASVCVFVGFTVCVASVPPLTELSVRPTIDVGRVGHLVCAAVETPRVVLVGARAWP